MRTHDNTLFITTQGSYLAREGDNLLVRVEKETKARFPIHTLGGLVCFGQVSMSPPAMGLCGDAGVSVSFLTEWGKFLARVEGAISGNVLLRRRQYRLAEDEPSAAAIARAMVSAKVANSRTVLLRALRDYPDHAAAPSIETAIERLAGTLHDLQSLDTLDQIRGAEGEAAQSYFAVFDHLITAQKERFQFQGRNRRPPLDRVNALLSFLYAILGHDARAACESVGLDPQSGFLHSLRPGRASLALDLMEEFRAFLADRLVLSLINRKQVSPKGFRTTESGAVEMDDDTRKIVLVAWQKRKQEELQHPFLKEKMTVGLLLHIQARLLARHLRGDLDAYPPFFWR